ncbi:MAG: M23 family metallopeptidase [Bacteroidales bacterium]
MQNRHISLRRILILCLFTLIILAGTNSRSSAQFNRITLRPPFLIQSNGSSYPITSYYDHVYPNYVRTDGQVTPYTGETRDAGLPFDYPGHPGYDWGTPLQTPIVAAADGTVVSMREQNNGYGNHIIIQHSNYYTLYAHLDSFDSQLTAQNPILSVTAGTIIGFSGNTGNSTGPHLHFGIYRGVFDQNVGIIEMSSTDPFGWRGNYPDPLLNYPSSTTGHTASCLWRSLEADPISCHDRIEEDRGSHFTSFPQDGLWEDRSGSADHSFTRLNQYEPSGYSEYGVWWFSPLTPGRYKIEFWQPKIDDATFFAHYVIVGATNGNVYITIDQADSPKSRWIDLGTYDFLVTPYIILYGYTGEAANTRRVTFDAMRIRFAPVNIPMIIR